MGTRGWEQQVGELNKNGEKVQTSSYKVKKYWKSNVRNNDYN